MRCFFSRIDEEESRKRLMETLFHIYMAPCHQFTSSENDVLCLDDGDEIRLTSNQREKYINFFIILIVFTHVILQLILLAHIRPSKLQFYYVKILEILLLFWRNSSSWGDKTAYRHPKLLYCIIFFLNNLTF